MAGVPSVGAPPEAFEARPSARDAALALEEHWVPSRVAAKTIGHWTAEPAAYWTGPSGDFILRCKASFRDVEVDTWTARGYVVLRLTEEGKGIYFWPQDEAGAGRLEIGIVTGAGDGDYKKGTFHRLTRVSGLDKRVGYSSRESDHDQFTFGVSGLEIYAKFNGVEFVRFQEYRHLEPGAVGFKANRGHGFRRIEVTPLEPVEVFSQPGAGRYDLRDFGLRETVATGSIEAGSDRLLLDAAPEPPFAVGDRLIVELGGEAGRGQRGTVGVGGTWPALSFATEREMHADQTQKPETHAWVRSDGSVFVWRKDKWRSRGERRYYLDQVIPKALQGRVLAVGSEGRDLTLDAVATTGAEGAPVHFDNAGLFYRLGRRPQYDGEFNAESERHPNDMSGVTPEGVTFSLPSGRFAVGAPVIFRGHPGWKLVGAGRDRSTLFSPRGVISLNLQFLECPGAEVRDLHLAGNARDHGFGLNVTERNVPKGIAFPHGLLFSRSDGARARDLLVSDVFQKAVGVSGSRDVWAERVHNEMTDGLRRYMQWQFQWADSVGGGARECSIVSPQLLAGFEAFKCRGTQFIDCWSLNGTAAMNSSGDFLFKNLTVHIAPGAQADELSFSHYNPVININSNTNSAKGYTRLGGVIENARVIQWGYISADNDSLLGINVYTSNPKVRILGGLYAAPDFRPPSELKGAMALNSSAEHTLVDGLRVAGESKGSYGNINLTHGAIKNCVMGKSRAGKEVEMFNNRKPGTQLVAGPLRPRSGRVLADPAGPDYRPGERVRLEAVPAPGFTFLRWGGAAAEVAGTAAEVTVRGTTLAWAEFVPAGTPR